MTADTRLFPTNPLTMGHAMRTTAARLQEADRLRSLAAALDRVKRRAEERMGEEDVRRLKRLDRFSHGLEVVGRGLIHLSMEPFSFLAGVGALWVHKQLQIAEIGHPVLHGCYDKLEGAESYQSKTFRWDVPIDEEAWRYGHNVKHHMYTNVVGKDQDVEFGPVRLTDKVPHRPEHYLQIPYTMFIMWPNFAFSMNIHFTGTADLFRDEPDILPDLSPASKRKALVQLTRKYVPYYAYNYVLFPMLAGAMWWKVLLGNWMAETARDVYSAATIFCGHIGEDVSSYEEHTRPKGKGGWYERQILGSQNFRVPYLVSVLCGGLDMQIEHHLFPKLPPERLREIAPEVEAICEEHGVAYHSGTWGEVLGRAFQHLWNLSFPNEAAAVDTSPQRVVDA